MPRDTATDAQLDEDKIAKAVAHAGRRARVESQLRGRIIGSEGTFVLRLSDGTPEYYLPLCFASACAPWLGRPEP